MDEAKLQKVVEDASNEAKAKFEALLHRAVELETYFPDGIDMRRYWSEIKAIKNARTKAVQPEPEPKVEEPKAEEPKLVEEPKVEDKVEESPKAAPKKAPAKPRARKPKATS